MKKLVTFLVDLHVYLPGLCAREIVYKYRAPGILEWPLRSRRRKPTKKEAAQETEKTEHDYRFRLQIKSSPGYLNSFLVLAAR